MPNEYDLKSRIIAAFGELPKDPSGLLAPLRLQGLERFQAMNFPKTSDEEWKYTSLAPLFEHDFIPVNGHRKEEISKKIIYKYAFSDMKRHLLVFINGHFSEEHSQLQGLSNGLVVSSLPEAVKNHPEIVETYLGKICGHGNDIFSEMSHAFLSDGAVVFIPDNMILKEPVHLMFLATNHSEPFMKQPRNLVILGRNSEATLVETYDALEQNIYFTNSVTEIVTGENAKLNHHKLQLESRNAFHVGSTNVLLNRDSRFLNTFISFGGRLTRNNIEVKLDAPGAEASLFGLYMGKDSQHIDNRIFMHHHHHSTTSNQIYKGILGDQSRGVFNGHILVDRDAQKTDAKQLNKNLLLSPTAKADTKPQLKIFADDVKCSHGATVGQLDDNSLFYLRSRGISESVARSMLTYAFASDIVDSIIIGSVRFYLYSVLLNRLGQGWDQISAK